MLQIQKGSVVRVDFFETDPFNTSSLAGVQLKSTGRMKTLVGKVRHIRTNDPSLDPKNTYLFIEVGDGVGDLCPRCGVHEVQVKASLVVEVIKG